MDARIESGHDAGDAGMDQEQATQSAIRKAAARLIPFLCLCYAVNFLDRVTASASGCPR